MSGIVINPTSLETKIFSIIVENTQAYWDNAYNERVRVQLEEIQRAHINRCLIEGWPVPQTPEAVVDDALARGTFKTAQQHREDEEQNAARKEEARIALAEEMAKTSEPVDDELLNGQ